MIVAKFGANISVLAFTSEVRSGSSLCDNAGKRFITHIVRVNCLHASTC